MFLHVLTHIETNKGFFSVKHELSKSFAKFSLSYSSRSKKHKRSNGLGWIIQPSTRSLNCLSDGLDSHVLTDHTVFENITHCQNAITLTFQKLIWRNSSPYSHNICDVISYDFVAQHLFFVSTFFFFNLFHAFQSLKFLFQGRQLGVLELSSSIKIKFTFSLFNLKLHRGNFIHNLIDTVDTSLLCHPFKCESLLFASQFVQLLI
mmetsp:Transcript_25576/g.36016  ORF Transcript_25576/g.36016 Transcript_25576/m.36016 type:complete len:205 (+) Transcript_25576:879-1493(+)